MKDSEFRYEETVGAEESARRKGAGQQMIPDFVEDAPFGVRALDEQDYDGPPVEDGLVPAQEKDGTPMASEPFGGEGIGEPGQVDMTGGTEVDPEMSVEEAFAELEQLIKRMETDGISLEESFACYEKGIRLVRFCNAKIDRVEKKVRILRGEGGMPGNQEM